MTDPLATLSKFTPVGPNRDDLLFAAGRASARPSRRWKWATGFLAVTQAVTLALWLWPKADPTPVPIPAPVVTPDPEPSAPPAPPDPHSYLALMHRDGDPEPRARFAPGPDRPTRPLTAGSRQFD